MSEAPTPVEVTIGPKAKKTILIVVACVVGAAIVAGAILLFIMLFMNKPTVDNHVATMVRLAGVSDAQDNVKSDLTTLVNSTFDSYSPTNSYDKILSSAKTDNDAAQKLVQRLDQTKNLVAGDQTSYKKLQSFLPVAKQTLADYNNVIADLTSGKDVLQSLAKYSNSFDDPLSFFNLYSGGNDFVTSATKAKADLQGVQQKLNAFQPKSDIFKAVKSTFATTLTAQINVATNIVASGNDLSALDNATTKLNDVLPDTSSLSDQTSKAFDSTTDLEKSGAAVADSLSSYVRNTFKLSSAQIHQKAKTILGQIKGDFSAGLYSKLQNELK